MNRKGRISVREYDDYLEISVKVLRNLYVIVPLLLSGAVWVYGLFFLIDNVFRSYRTLIEMGIATMLFFWLILGAAIFSTLYWIFFGRERIILTPEFIQTEKPIHLYRRRRAYPISDVSRLRVSSEWFKVKRNGTWEDDQRTVLQFDTPYKKVTFGRGIRPEEAEFILLEIAKSDYLREDQFEPVSVS